MLDMFIKVLGGIWQFAQFIVYPVLVLLALFFVLCGFHFLYFIITSQAFAYNRTGA